MQRQAQHSRQRLLPPLPPTRPLAPRLGEVNAAASADCSAATVPAPLALLELPHLSLVQIYAGGWSCSSSSCPLLIFLSCSDPRVGRAPCSVYLTFFCVLITLMCLSDSWQCQWNFLRSLEKYTFSLKKRT